MSNTMRQIPMEEVEAHLGGLIDRIERLEHDVSKKADDVVQVQILQRREEIEELEHKILTLEKEMEELKSRDKVTVLNKKEVEKKTDVQYPRLKQKMMSIFSFLF